MYFVSHGGEAFPSLVVVLQGDGVRVDLTGSTFIDKHGITSSTFKTVPDVPVNTFELYLPEGQYSALGGERQPLRSHERSRHGQAQGHTRTVHGRTIHRTVTTHTVSRASLQMPSEFVGQNGAVIKAGAPRSRSPDAHPLATKAGEEMIANRRQRAVRSPVTLTATILLAGARGARRRGAPAAAPPVKEVLASHFGAKVNATTGGNFCTIASGDTCQPGEASAIPGGFGEFSRRRRRVAPNGNIYVADTNNQRVQELKPNGEFVLMFGKEVNETAHLNHETVNEDLCPVKAGDKCKVGISGHRIRGICRSPHRSPSTPTPGTSTLRRRLNYRVDEYTATGTFRPDDRQGSQHQQNEHLPLAGKHARAVCPDLGAPNTACSTSPSSLATFWLWAVPKTCCM